MLLLIGTRALSEALKQSPFSESLVPPLGKRRDTSVKLANRRRMKSVVVPPEPSPSPPTMFVFCQPVLFPGVIRHSSLLISFLSRHTRTYSGATLTAMVLTASVWIMRASTTTSCSCLSLLCFFLHIFLVDVHLSEMLSRRVSPSRSYCAPPPPCSPSADDAVYHGAPPSPIFKTRLFRNCQYREMVAFEISRRELYDDVSFDVYTLFVWESSGSGSRDPGAP